MRRLTMDLQTGRVIQDPYPQVATTTIAEACENPPHVTDLVVQAIRHEKAPITVTTFADSVVKINKDEEERDGTMHRLQPLDWVFDEKTR